MKRFFKALPSTNKKSAKLDAQPKPSTLPSTAPSSSEGPSTFLSFNLNGAQAPSRCQSYTSCPSVPPLLCSRRPHQTLAPTEPAPTHTGLAMRLKPGGGWSEFMLKVQELDPDIIALQEVTHLSSATACTASSVRLLAPTGPGSGSAGFRHIQLGTCPQLTP